MSVTWSSVIFSPSLVTTCLETATVMSRALETDLLEFIVINRSGVVAIEHLECLLYLLLCDLHLVTDHIHKLLELDNSTPVSVGRLYHSLQRRKYITSRRDLSRLPLLCLLREPYPSSSSPSPAPSHWWSRPRPCRTDWRRSSTHSSLRQKILRSCWFAGDCCDTDKVRTGPAGVFLARGKWWKVKIGSFEDYIPLNKIEDKPWKNKIINWWFWALMHDNFFLEMYQHSIYIILHRSSSNYRYCTYLYNHTLNKGWYRETENQCEKSMKLINLI